MLTAKSLRTKWKGKDRWMPDKGARGAGQLVARILRGGAMLYYGYPVRYVATEGKHRGQERTGQKRLPLGPYDETGARGLTLAEARMKVAELAELFRNGITDVHGHLEREREAAERARLAEEETRRRAIEDAQRGTLRQLLDARVNYLKQRGSTKTARDERSMFDNHVIEAAKDVADLKAAEVGVSGFVSLISKLVEANKGRAADKLRSSLRATYQLAIDSSTDPSIPITFRTFGITVNPLASIGALSQFNKARTRTLSAPEMTAFLKRLDAVEPAPQRDALKMLLFLGGQRPAQMLRAKAKDVDLAASTITLYDPKGRRSTPRRHVLPLVKEAHTILKTRLDAIGDQHDAPVFSTDDDRCMRPETLSNLITDLSRVMVTAKEVREPFMLSDVRRTCETMLASLKVSKDIRAQLLSHGLGGVQGRHYDQHTYDLEKMQALKKWVAHLAKLKTGEVAKVVSIEKARA